ncbi:MAG: hypothetical protein J4478_03210, partial [Candidatus Diapherotrites archaeon]|nr:hypothetical protein [Candidatus Diapherotrites archaeon]
MNNYYIVVFGEEWSLLHSGGKFLLLAVFLLFFSSLAFALPPSLTGISAPTVQQNSLQTLTPQGLTQAQGNPLNFYCCVSQDSSCIPSSSNSICSNPGPFSSPYSQASCSFTASQALGTYNARCRAVDSITGERSAIKSSSFEITSSVPLQEPCERTEFSNVFCNPDGSRTSELYTAPVNYFDDSVQAFVPIDSTVVNADKASALEKDYNSVVRKGKHNVFFKDDVSSQDAVKFQAGSYWVSFQALELSFADASKKQLIQTASGKKGSASQSQNLKKFSNIFLNGVDLQYRYLSTGLREELVISNKGILPALQGLSGTTFIQLREKISFAPGLAMFVNNSPFSSGKVETSGKISFKDSSGTEVFFIPESKAWDSANSLQSGSYVIEKTGSETFITNKIPTSWVLNNARSFPLTIDSSVEISSTNVTDGYFIYNEELGFDCSSTTNTTLLAGSDGVTGGPKSFWRSHLTFDISSIADGSTIIGTSLQLYTDSYYG